MYPYDNVHIYRMGRSVRNTVVGLVPSFFTRTSNRLPVFQGADVGVRSQ